MAAVAITETAIPVGGYNLTDSADFTALVAGSGNGVSFTYNSKDVILLKNATAGAAVFTVKTRSFSQLDALSITPADYTVNVAVGKTHVFEIAPGLRESDGSVIIECDVAGEVLILRNDPS